MVNICEFLRKIRDGLAISEGCLVSLQVGNKTKLQPIGDDETRLVVVDGLFQSVTITDDEWENPDALADEIITLMIGQRKEANA